MQEIDPSILSRTIVPNRFRTTNLRDARFPSGTKRLHEVAGHGVGKLL
jgi:hypothetical protein